MRIRYACVPYLRYTGLVDQAMINFSLFSAALAAWYINFVVQWERMGSFGESLIVVNPVRTGLYHTLPVPRRWCVLTCDDWAPDNAVHRTLSGIPRIESSIP